VHYDAPKKAASSPAGPEAAGQKRTRVCGRARLVQNRGLHRDKLGGGLSRLGKKRFRLIRNNKMPLSK
jgi:hypothetical protein